MPFSPVADLAFFFQDFGVPVVVGGVSTVGIFDRTLKAEGFGQQDSLLLMNDPSVLVQAGKVPENYKTGYPISVDGRDYKIRSREAESDGALERFYLQVVS